MAASRGDLCYLYPFICNFFYFYFIFCIQLDPKYVAVKDFSHYILNHFHQNPQLFVIGSDYLSVKHQ